VRELNGQGASAPPFFLWSNDDLPRFQGPCPVPVRLYHFDMLDSEDREAPALLFVRA
jgi:hypothetical protein